jgi:filamentous hemagglutinin family protein
MSKGTVMDNQNTNFWTWFRESIIALFIVLAMCYVPTTQGEVTFDGSMGAPGTLQGPNMEINADRGRIEGNNLFHSFSQFSVNTGETANFSGPANIQNIVGRVSGPNASNIDGTISSSITGANLFLMNPHGIMFGPNAEINITGSFHATTADYISLGNNERFYADLNQNTTLSVASPSAFGFLDNNVGNISIDSSNINVGLGNTLSMIGGDINIINQANVSTHDGQINLASTQSAGEFTVALGQTDTEQFNNLGSIRITDNSTVNSSGSEGGRVVIRGGELVVDSSTVSADIEIYSTQIDPNIDIKTRESITVENGAKVSADLRMFADGTSSGIDIETGNLTVVNHSSIQSSANFLSFGNAGNIDIVAADITIDNYSKIRSNTESTGDSGNITISLADSLQILDASSISTAADWLFGEGISGDITIESNEILILGLTDPLDPDVEDFTGIDAGFSIINGNNSGDIHVDANNISMMNNAQMRTITEGAYNSGNITIDSNNLALTAGSNIHSGASDGTSGDININNSERLLITGTSPNPNPISRNRRRSAVISSGGEGSNIILNSDSIVVSDGGFITSAASFSTSPTSGNIELNANSVKVTGYNLDIYNDAIADGESTETALSLSQSKILSSARNDLLDTNEVTTSGSISINTDRFEITDHGSIEAQATYTDTTPSNTNAGAITINARNTVIDQANLLAQTNNSDGGNIAINNSKSLVINDSYLSSSVSEDEGQGGNIHISSDIMAIRKSTFEASAIEDDGGNITLASNILIVANDNIFNVSSDLAMDGNIVITSDVVLQDSLSKLPSTKIDTTQLLPSSCFSNEFSTLSHTSLFQPLTNLDLSESPSTYMDITTMKEKVQYTNERSTFLKEYIAPIQTANNSINCRLK